MTREPNRSSQLRQLAQQLMAQVPEELLTSPRRDLSTSLVRQWLTYDGHATLFFGSEQHYFRPDPQPNGDLHFSLHRVSSETWFRQIMREWDFGPDELRQAVRQMNLGQSAQIENRCGEFLRLWVNPTDRSKSIERLSPPSPSAVPKGSGITDLARSQIDNLFQRINDRDKEDLIAALVRQWTMYDGHALILTPEAKFHLFLEQLPEGTRITIKSLKTALPRKLLDCGLDSEEIAAFLHVLNLGLSPEITDERGRRCLVKMDPKKAAVYFDEIPPPGLAVFQINVGL